MINPRDLDEFFAEDAKKWLPDQKENLENITEKLEIAPPGLFLKSCLGTDMTSRMFVFVYQPQTDGFSRMGDDWKPSFKCDKREFKSVRPKLWEERIELKPGTIIKVFAGVNVGTGWDAEYFELVHYAECPEIVVVHPNNDTLFTSGRMQKVPEFLYGNYGLPPLVNKKGNMKLIIQKKETA